MDAETAATCAEKMGRASVGNDEDNAISRWEHITKEGVKERTDGDKGAGGGLLQRLGAMSQVAARWLIFEASLARERSFQARASVSSFSSQPAHFLRSAFAEKAFHSSGAGHDCHTCAVLDWRDAGLRRRVVCLVRKVG